MTTHHRIAGAKGGSRRTPSKAAALARLHASRRGRRIHPMDAATRRLLARVAGITAQTIRGGAGGPDPRSRRALATELGVSDRTIRRWLSGVDVPDPRHLPALRAWVARLGPP